MSTASRQRSRHLVLSLPRGGSLRGTRRPLWAGAITALSCLVLLALGVFTGTYHIGTAEVFDVLGGGGSAMDRFIVVGQRMPRVCAALLVGAGLGLAGSLFQSLSRNPLGSPDIIGFTTGSTTGALAALLIGGGTSLGAGGGALLGGLATALLVHVLSAMRGAVGGRLIVTGIAVGAMLASVNDFLITRADIESAESAKAWTFGSLNAITWPHVVPAAAAFPLLLAATVVLARPLQMMSMGDDTAAALGVRVDRIRALTLLVGVAWTAVAIAVAGPIGFLALAAPQLARRLARSGGVPVFTAALMGALLLACADFAGQRLLAPFQIPVGLVTGALGGLYLMWLLYRKV
ncbi:iron chelate uptake ABC transporter family permease subunit [Streptomyces sp. NBC_00006]|uniref:FecCD family ABC transporter permease n=1 Tax=unclassified Streptomyces TaxID=2593676 RepID=UPI00225616DD|nr:MULTISPECIES: iron chelate uptake ABC transporter family permease subunit [unclassified Streptomyces]MCX5536408.1 iron chelate uptake ABC transporter family permease subunit [Streptomyces sp. NBC_00006]